MCSAHSFPTLPGGPGLVSSLKMPTKLVLIFHTPIMILMFPYSFHDSHACFLSTFVPRNSLEHPKLISKQILFQVERTKHLPVLYVLSVKALRFDKTSKQDVSFIDSRKIIFGQIMSRKIIFRQMRFFSFNETQRACSIYLSPRSSTVYQ